MSYEEIIQKNSSSYCKKFPWWATHAFHDTDLSNALSILESGILYSRSKTTEKSLMNNDNASRQVIDMTDSTITSFVRFYFRPLTPTQFYNEGYKHPELRYQNDVNANIPVPIFFAFNLKNLLIDPQTRFSEKSQAGYFTPEVLCGEKNFSELNFEKIYAVGAMENPEEDKKFRQAEILYPQAYKIDSSLDIIICRNEIDRGTFLKLLKERNIKLYYKYKEKIRIGKDNIFENNGFFISSLNYYNNQLDITFNDSFQKMKYDKRQKQRNGKDELSELNCLFIFKWYDRIGKELNSIRWNHDLRYDISSISLKFPTINGAKKLTFDFYIEQDFLCSRDFTLHEGEVF